MATAVKKTVKQVEEKTANQSTAQKKVSKTWLAALKNVGTGKILDMRAVLK